MDHTGECTAVNAATDYLANLPAEVHDSVLRLQLDPDDQGARITLFYHCKGVIRDAIRKWSGENESYSNYQFLEEMAFFRVVKELNRYDRNRGGLDQSVSTYTRWAMGDLRKTLDGRKRVKGEGQEDGTGKGGGKSLFAGGRQKLLPKVRNMFEPSNRTYIRHQEGHTYRVSPVIMDEEMVARTLRQSYEWRIEQKARDERKRREEAKATPERKGPPARWIPPEKNKTEDTSIWFNDFLEDFFSYLRKGKPQGSPLVESGIYLMKEYYVEWKNYGDIFRSFLDLIRKLDWEPAADVTEGYVRKRIWDLTRRMRDYYWENAAGYAFVDYDPFANLPVSREDSPWRDA